MNKQCYKCQEIENLIACFYNTNLSIIPDWYSCQNHLDSQCFVCGYHREFCKCFNHPLKITFDVKQDKFISRILIEFDFDTPNIVSRFPFEDPPELKDCFLIKEIANIVLCDKNEDDEDLTTLDLKNTKNNTYCYLEDLTISWIHEEIVCTINDNYVEQLLDLLNFLKRANYQIIFNGINLHTEGLFSEDKLKEIIFQS